MKIEKINLKLTLAILFLYSSLGFSQNSFQVVIRVIDAETNLPVTNASILLKEKGWQSESVDQDGKAIFKDVMSRDVNFVVIAEDYERADYNKNIAGQEESNTFEIKLNKPKEHRFILTGEVIDKNGDDVSGATVEFKLVNIIEKVLTDESGNYFLEIDLEKLLANSTEATLEVKKEDCKIKEEFIITKNVLTKTIILECLGKDKEQAEVIQKKKGNDELNPENKQPSQPKKKLGGSVCFTNAVEYLKDRTDPRYLYLLEAEFTTSRYSVRGSNRKISIPYDQEKCFYSLTPGVYNYLFARSSIGGKIQIEGQILIEEGKTIHISLTQ